MPNIGPLEIIVVLIIALVVLGPRKLPEFGRSVGKGMREFKSALPGREEERSSESEAEARLAVPAQAVANQTVGQRGSATHRSID